MSVLVVGMSHRSAPVALLERLSMDDAMQHDSARALVDQPSLSEAMIISTCNRLEIYAVTNAFHTGVNDVLHVLERFSGVDIADLRGYLYVRYADAAANHLMRVASGLDSMVVGEQQIIGQVRSAYQDAADRGTVGATLHALAQSALHAGKRVHSETAIDDAGASMVTAALDEAMRRMGVSDLEGRSALVLGAGAMSSLAATQLGKLGVSKLILANRTRSRAERLAEHAREAGISAEVVDFSGRAGALSRVDIAVSATASDGFTITAEDISGPTVLVDLSLPRDIDNAVADVPGVTLVNIEAVHESLKRASAAENAHGCPEIAARDQAEAIVSDELATFTSEQRVRDIAPIVTELRVSAAETAQSELDKLRGRLPDLEDGEFAEVEKTVRRVVDKLLHNPTVKIKQLAGKQSKVSYEIAIEELFGLTGGADTRTGFGASFEKGSLAGFCERGHA